MKFSLYNIGGARVYDKSYKASEPKEVALTNLANRCAYFTEEISGDGSTEKCLVIMVPRDEGYIFLLQFRSAPKSFDEHWNMWWDIANTLRVFSAD